MNITPEQEKQMEEVIERAWQSVKMKEDREKWRENWKKYRLEDALKKSATPEEAFEAGWRAAFSHRLSELMEEYQSTLDLSVPDARK